MDNILLKSQLDYCIFRDFKSLYYCFLHVFDYDVFEAKWKTLCIKKVLSKNPSSLHYFDLYQKLVPDKKAFAVSESSGAKKLRNLHSSYHFIHFLSLFLHGKSTNNKAVTWRGDTLYSISEQMIHSPVHHSLFSLLLMDVNSIIAENKTIELEASFVETYLTAVLQHPNIKSELALFHQ